MADAVLIAGVVAQAVVWHLVGRGRLPLWPATTATFVALGIVSLAAMDVACCAETAAGTAAVSGLVSGIALYGATRVVVGLATRVASLRAAVAGVYGSGGEAPFAAVLVLTVALAVPGEELFWRGLLQPEVRAATSPFLGSILAWVAYVGVNVATLSLPLVAGAVVGGAAWTALGAWSGGVLAPIASHAVWTCLMLVWPPSAARDKVAL